MFCPNCGTKNDDSALKCSQCGFDVKPRVAASKHKGTVMFTASPAAAAGAGAKPSPNLKGTMVGVAPPDVTGGASAAPVAPKASNSALKGTMVGVAPPGLEDMRKQAAASRAASTPQGVNPGGSVAARSQAGQGPSSKLKGTMIGLAPPDMGAEVEAAKAKLAAKKAESAQARAAAEAAKNAGETGASAPTAQATPAQATPQAARSQAAASSSSKGPPSQLKGTMIGVAPPNMQAQINAARELANAKKAKADATAAAEAAASRIATAATAPEEKEPPSEPDPLGGTMVGMSPFASSAFAKEGASTHSQGTPAPVNFDDNTPPAGSEAPGDATSGAGIASGADIAAGADIASGADIAPEVGIAGTGIAEAGAGSVGAVVDYGGSSDVRPPDLGGVDSAPLRTNTLEQPRIPVAKSSAGPIALIIVLVAIVVGGVMYLLNKKSDDTVDEDPAAEEAGPDSKAAE